MQKDVKYTSLHQVILTVSRYFFLQPLTNCNLFVPLKVLMLQLWMLTDTLQFSLLVSLVLITVNTHLSGLRGSSVQLHIVLGDHQFPYFLTSALILVCMQVLSMDLKLRFCFYVNIHRITFCLVCCLLSTFCFCLKKPVIHDRRCVAWY